MRTRPKIGAHQVFAPLGAALSGCPSFRSSIVRTTPTGHDRKQVLLHENRPEATTLPAPHSGSEEPTIPQENLQACRRQDWVQSSSTLLKKLWKLNTWVREGKVTSFISNTIMVTVVKNLLLSETLVKQMLYVLEKHLKNFENFSVMKYRDLSSWILCVTMVKNLLPKMSVEKIPVITWKIFVPPSHTHVFEPYLKRTLCYCFVSIKVTYLYLFLVRLIRRVVWGFPWCSGQKAGSKDGDPGFYSRYRQKVSVCRIDVFNCYRYLHILLIEEE